MQYSPSYIVIGKLVLQLCFFFAAQEQRFDVVLIDTAGRMQDNEPLMRALAKLITINLPDLVLFVGKYKVCLYFIW